MTRWDAPPEEALSAGRRHVLRGGRDHLRCSGEKSGFWVSGEKLGFWMGFGWFLDGFGWVLDGCWMVLGGFWVVLDGFGWDFGWVLDGFWMVLDGFWMVVGWFWMGFGWLLDGFGWVLGGFGWFWVGFWMVSDGFWMVFVVGVRVVWRFIVGEILALLQGLVVIALGIVAVSLKQKPGISSESLVVTGDEEEGSRKG